VRRQSAHVQSTAALTHHVNIVFAINYTDCRIRTHVVLDSLTCTASFVTLDQRREALATCELPFPSQKCFGAERSPIHDVGALHVVTGIEMSLTYLWLGILHVAFLILSREGAWPAGRVASIIMTSAPPLCSCTKQELLRDFDGSRVGDPCPLCASLGLQLAIGLHAMATPVVALASPSDVVIKLGLTPSSQTIRYASGNSYTGELRDGVKHGKGTFAFADGEEYTGEFVDGDRHGIGTYRYKDGRVYEGQWELGQRCGYGILYSPSGAIIDSGIWQYGELLRRTGGATSSPSPPSSAAPTPVTVAPASFTVVASDSTCPASRQGHAYRKRWTCCSYLLCLLGCCYCALMQRTRVCKHCGHRSD